MFALQETPSSPQSALTEVLELHRQWLASGGAEGEQLDLCGIDLREFKFSSCDLRRARFVRSNLSGVSFAKSDLEGADLAEANLSRANFDGANLKDARLYNANLEGALLGEASFLRSSQLCGTNLSHATMPRKIEFYGLDQAKQAASRLAVQFVSVLTVSLYAWLTIGSTKDVDLLTNARSVSF